jgi:hypothetical protein
MAKIPWGIEWQTDPPDTQNKDIEQTISWIIKAVPEPDPAPVPPDTAIMPTVTQYEILVNEFPSSVIVDETDETVGVQISGDVGNPFPFQSIGYVSPKGDGSTQSFVARVEDLPPYHTIDIFEFIPSNQASRIDSITIRATASDFDTPTPDIYTIEGTFQINTINNWDKVIETLDEIIG